MGIDTENITGRHFATDDGGFVLWQACGMFFGQAVFRSDSENLVCHILVQKGRIFAEYGGKVFSLAAGDYVNFIDSPEVRFFNPDECFSAMILCSSDTFIMKLLKNTPPFEASYITRIKLEPVIHLDVRHMMLVGKRMCDVLLVMENEEHIFRNEMLGCSLRIMLMDIGNIFSTEYVATAADRKMQIFQRFIRLLHTDVHKRHTVGWYATKLCITPQYLNRIVKMLTGKTSYDWICTALVGEIARRLDDTDHPVGVISDECYFPDQATMTNLFKRHMGMTPGQYRRRLLSSPQSRR
ncbi:MAG: helix-turn-helix domain-containing protein [Candidatus Cryptobacteroides sp.]